MKKEIQKGNNGELKLGDKLNFAEINLNALTESLDQLVLPRLFYQLVIFLIDGSNSMNGKTENGTSKAVSIDESIKSIVKRIKASKNKNCFDLSFIAFSDEFQDVFSIKNLLDVDNNQSFNPLKMIANPGGTKLSDALKYSKGVIDDYLSTYSDKSSQAILIILSDGAIDDNNNALKIASTIKSMDKVTLACQYLESHIDEDSVWHSWDEETGKVDYASTWTTEEVREYQKKVAKKFMQYASQESLFITSVNPDIIRDHMIKSISTVSNID